MAIDQLLEQSGLTRIPPYWDARYTKNLDQLSKPMYTVKFIEDVCITLRDGVKIYVDAYVPAELEAAPVLLSWASYGKTMQALKRGTLSAKSLYFDHSLEAGDIDFFVTRGYAFVIPDPRGIGKSEGEFLGVYNPQEQEDVYDVIEWIGGKESWCNGKVAMLGYSYFGLIQMLGAAQQPPHLTCIMPLSFSNDYYQHGYYGGVPNTYMSMYWELCPSPNPTAWSTKLYSEETLKAMIDAKKEEADLKPISYFSKIFNTWPPKFQPFFLDYLLHSEDGPFWEARSTKTMYDKVQVPVYMKCGWSPNGRWSAPVFDAMNDAKLSVPKRCAVMEAYNGMELPYRFMNEECLRWYDHWMKGVDTGIMDEPPFKINIVGRGYRYEREYPLNRTEWKKLYLRTFGELRWEKDPEGQLPPDSFTHRPPNITDQFENILYRSPIFTKPTEFTGPIELHLFASIDAEDANFIVKVWQIMQSGKRLPISRYGALKASHAYDPERSQIGRPAHDHTKRVAIEPGKINEYIIEVNPIGMVFAPGTQIELEVTSMDAFEYQGHSWTGKVGAMGPIPSANTINYKIYRDADYPSYLLLPYIPNTPGDLWLQTIE